MTLSEELLVGAFFAQIVWTMVVGFLTGRARFGAAGAGRIKGDIALSDAGWPDDVRKVANNFNNQWETPTLFYALILMALHLKLASLFLAAMAFLYVASRVAHSYIHITSNVVVVRARIFFVGIGALIAMTAALIFTLLTGTHL